MASIASDRVWRKRYERIRPAFDRIELPHPERLDGRPDQDEEWCEVHVDGHREHVRFHDYDQIFERPGLYEALFYDHLECCSPSVVVNLLDDVLADFDIGIEDLRVLDLGAGNGMDGDELADRGVERLVGIDLIDEARRATQRDRPGVYDDYLVADLTDLEATKARTLAAHEPNALTSVAALGYGDIPPEAFGQALDLIATPGWLAFNVKADFLAEHDSTGFARLVRELTRREVIQTWSIRRYQHRRSMTGDPLYYVAMVARKVRELPAELRP